MSAFTVTKIAEGLYRVADQSEREVGKIHEGPARKHDFVPKPNLAFGADALRALADHITKLDTHDERAIP